MHNKQKQTDPHATNVTLKQEKIDTNIHLTTTYNQTFTPTLKTHTNTYTHIHTPIHRQTHIETYIDINPHT